MGAVGRADAPKGRCPRLVAGAAGVQIDTPDSVVEGHLSRRPVTRPLEPPTRDSASRLIVPVWRCTAWGLPSRPRHRGRWCALTAPFHPYPTEVGRSVFCGALPSGFPAQALPGTLLCGVRTFLPVSEETRRSPDLQARSYRMSPISDRRRGTTAAAGCGGARDGDREPVLHTRGPRTVRAVLTWRLCP